MATRWRCPPEIGLGYGLPDRLTQHAQRFESTC